MLYEIDSEVVEIEYLMVTDSVEVGETQVVHDFLRDSFIEVNLRSITNLVHLLLELMNLLFTVLYYLSSHLSLELLLEFVDLVDGGALLLVVFCGDLC